MPQCKECFKPIVSEGLCRPCRDEHMDPNDVTQEMPNQALKPDDEWVAPMADDEELVFREG